MIAASQTSLFSESVDAEHAPAIASQLRDAARALGYATLAMRAGHIEQAHVHIRLALRAIVLVEGALPIPSWQRVQR